MRTFFIFVILLVLTLAHPNGHHFKNKFKDFMKIRERKNIGHSYSEIFNEVNQLKLHGQLQYIK